MAAKKKAKSVPKRSVPKKSGSRGSTPVRSGALRDPWTGRFVENTKKEADRIERRAQRELRAARTERSRAFRRAQAGAKKPETRQRYAEKYQDASAKADAAMLKAEKAKKELEKSTAVQRAAARAQAPAQWEFGVAYVASRRDRGSDVNFNIRVRREDRKGITKEEAVRVIERIAQDGAESVQDEYVVYGVEWSRARGRTERGQSRWSDSVRRGDADDVDAFQPILMEAIFKRNGEGLRMGAVREHADWTEQEDDA
ncbi:MAG: hypothetical protein WC729_30080 [Sphingomonas sp.]|jgi:hypothetical protein|uniref:hypothetical protein n=1 Tax=Sphingomonas sp. TaxID=28214 RepID=UPI003567BBDF